MKTVAKERRTTAPKELIRRGTAQATAKTKQQIMEASHLSGRIEPENKKGTTTVVLLIYIRGKGFCCDIFGTLLVREWYHQRKEAIPMSRILTKPELHGRLMEYQEE